MSMVHMPIAMMVTVSDFTRPVLIRVGSHDEAANGTHDKADAKHHETHENADNGIFGREELRGNDNLQSNRIGP